MNTIRYEKLSYQMTEKLLKSVAERTSGRKDFNKLEYEVTISALQIITFYPERCVYRNNRNAVKYTTDDMIKGIVDSLENFSSFIPGKYRYCYYKDDKSRRHWIKEEERKE